MTPPVQYTSTAYPTTHYRLSVMSPQRDAWLALVATFTRGFALTAIVTIVVGASGHLWSLDSLGLCGFLVIAGWTGAVAGRVLEWSDTIRNQEPRAAAHATRHRPPL